MSVTTVITLWRLLLKAYDVVFVEDSESERH